ncbi:MAG TPA: carboxymuconolactone decarboxylase family protein [Actinomycetota bacterium]|nr:carboxymuconolactone decarboxylase family protein [Actinomycetota bacterium]
MAGYEQKLRWLAVHDERFIGAVFSSTEGNLETSGLDAKTHALVRLGAFLALGATPACLQSDVEAALAAGASEDEVVGTLIAVAPEIGSARAVSEAPELGLALGYDVEAALQEPAGERR